MMAASRSLRQRLFMVIMLPLILMSLLLGYWRYNTALYTAKELFDRSLLAAALAISRDIAQSEGDALTAVTRDLIRDAAGEQVFYHVTGPAGSYLTGYAYPPVSLTLDYFMQNSPVYFDGEYRGEPVRVLRLRERRSNDFVAGDSTVTVWQENRARRAFAQQLGVRAMALMGALLFTLALVVWFGVKLGLRPLTDLQQAIATRSPTDLSTIKRPIPIEVYGIVATLNRLFGRVSSSFDAHQNFISDASHQLRNPAAAVLSMAEAVRDASSESEREQRVKEMVKAAHSLSHVTEQLLSLERLHQSHWQDKSEDLNLVELIRQVCTATAVGILGRGTEFEFDGCAQSLVVHAEPVLLAEAIKNLIDNAVKHGGKRLKKIQVKVHMEKGFACVTVLDDGEGLRPEDQDKAFSRFGQLEPSSGSGLGLAIAYSVALQHGGELRIDSVAVGASISLWLPLLGTHFEDRRVSG